VKAQTRILQTVTVLFAGLSLGVSGHGQSAETSAPANHAQLYCSPAPCVLPPTQAAPGVDSPIVTNPLNAKDLLLSTLCCASVVAYFSPDGGSSWNLGTFMSSITVDDLEYVPGGEPGVAYDRRGAAYIAGTYEDNAGQGTGLVAIQKSTNGTKWSQPVVALFIPGDLPYNSGLAVDTSPSSPHLNNLYVSGVMEYGLTSGKVQVLVSHSTDGGATWKQVAVDRVQRYPAYDVWTRPAVGKDGTVYVAWLHCPGSGPDQGCIDGNGYVMFAKSTDGGGTWSTPRRVATVGLPLGGYLPNTSPGVRVYNYPEIATDTSDAPHGGNLYIAMYSWTGTYLRVQMIRSTNGGDSWSQPLAPAPSSDTHDQFFPSISVSPTGLVGLSWLDRRNDPANVEYQAFAAISSDGGKTFQRNWQLTRAFSDPNGNFGFIGDYTGNTWAGRDFVAAWMDSSKIVDVVGGVRLK
jgi:hypothetical protein